MTNFLICVLFVALWIGMEMPGLLVIGIVGTALEILGRGQKKFFLNNEYLIFF